MNPRRRLPSTTALLCFDSVASTLSMTASAQAMHLTQGAVSRQIAELEAFVGVPLFERVRKRLQLSDAGRDYLQQLRPLLAALERCTFDLRASQAAPRHLNLSIASTFGNRWLIPRLADFYARCPDVVLNLSTQVGLPDFEAARLHAAVVYCKAPPPGFEGCFIHPLVLFPVAARGATKARPPRRGATAFEGRTLLTHTTVPEAWPEYFRTLGQAPADAQYGPRFDLLSMGHQAALAGMGVALLPAYLVADDLRAGRLVRLHQHQVQTEGAYWLIYPRRFAALVALQQLQAWLKLQGQPLQCA